MRVRIRGGAGGPCDPNPLIYICFFIVTLLSLHDYNYLYYGQIGFWAVFRQFLASPVDPDYGDIFAV